MTQEMLVEIEKKLTKSDFEKLQAIPNAHVHRFIIDYVMLCNPDQVVVCSDAKSDREKIRDAALKNREEASLLVPGHTVHFDGFFDQARDKDNTKFLVDDGCDFGPEINTLERQQGIAEIHRLLQNCMVGREVFVKFYCLGPSDSVFSIPCVQLTDSTYVAHSEDLLFRQGYQQFVHMNRGHGFFKFVHSQGELINAGLGLRVSKNVDNRRVFIDLSNDVIFSVNTQYGGNTIGLKKLAMRLAINKASKEGWLTEHMLLMGVHGPDGDVSYFSGAFPSMCGKTSTAMIHGESIVGDDIVYLRVVDGVVRGVNVEQGMFGIIEGINKDDDPLQWDALHSENEIIFTNVLVTPEKGVFWNGKQKLIPGEGVNYSGRWLKGKKNDGGVGVLPSHKNARFTFALDILHNVDENLHNPCGVAVSGMIYGGRDSDTSVPVEESFDWTHGVVMKGAGLESETTAATLGEEGLRVFNPMSNLDFLSIPIGRYVLNNLKFGLQVKCPPKIFSVNYFLRGKDGFFLNHKNDKKVWLKWMERRVHHAVDALKTPTGLIPLFQDLKQLFETVEHKRYSKAQYDEQFMVRIPENLEKIKRLEYIFSKRVPDTPPIVFKVFKEQARRLEDAKHRFGEYISPDCFRKS